ncbi:hypothetical protein EDD59_11123 [Muricomes intestini]|mgnify:CR=1 FL=1|jgi:hypothetical protein|uniref:Uncharacterized protein n=1 Tax=Muricomes intestini TaxID=1796634 RepID=A0A4R3K6W5_9FIRM|nr:hypothetical protein EDD59_11123 [Muricomes intestini]
MNAMQIATVVVNIATVVVIICLIWYIRKHSDE